MLRETPHPGGAVPPEPAQLTHERRPPEARREQPSDPRPPVGAHAGEFAERHLGPRGRAGGAHPGDGEPGLRRHRSAPAAEPHLLAPEREQQQHPTPAAAHVSCHISILKLSPSLAFIPSAAATSYPE